MGNISKSLGLCLLLCILTLLALALPAMAEKATLKGKVTDSAKGEALPGANIVVKAEGAQTGAASNIDGEYEVRNITPGTYAIRVSFIGYETVLMEDVTLSEDEVRTLDFALEEVGIQINPIAITASRRSEKTLDAPASISVIEPREISQEVSTSSSTVLRNVTGVDLAQTGVDRREIVLRGFNNAFSGSAYVLTDYRRGAVASLGVNLHAIMPNQGTDLNTVEIVRGPGSALYGPGVDEGVIHYLTKGPFEDPGTTVSFSGGERTALAAQFRHAGVFGGHWGYKITGQYAQADDWTLDPSDSLDAIQLSSDAVPRNNDYQKLNVNGMVEHRFDDVTSLIFNGGFSMLDAVVLSGIGTLQADGFGYAYGQVRFRRDRFFAQAYLNRNNAGDSFIYRTGQEVTDNSTFLKIESQYDLEMADGKQQFIFGADYQRTTPDTDGEIYGINEDRDLISETGVYVQSQTQLNEKLDATVALRLDHNNLQDDIFFSPRVGLVFKPTPQHSLRGTFNRAFSSPGNNSNFLDIQAGSIPGTDINIRARGSAFGFNFGRNPAFEPIAGTDLIAYSLNPAALGAPTPVGLPLDATYASVYDGLSQIPIPVLRMLLPPPFNDPNQVPDAAIQLLIDQLAPANTSVVGFSRGSLGILNLTDLSVNPVMGVTDIEPLKRTTTQTFEFGYKGLVQNRILFAIDTYITRKKNFVGPLLMETPFVFVPTLASDLQAALAQGITDNQTLSAILAGAGFTPEQVAQLLVNLAAEDLPDAETPVAIVAPNENAPALGETPQLMLAYRNFGEVNFWGIDATIQVLLSERLNLFGNVSFVSDDFFDNEELDETDTDLELALNAPKFKTKFGFSYSVPLGPSFNASARYIEGFPVLSGPFIGDVENYFLLDIGAGYDLSRYAPGLRFDVTINNILDNEHREFIGAPKLGRFAMARLSFTR